jgi:nucleotide-binding universal stress UspA family protein
MNTPGFMTILCGTDFSALATSATRVAAALAKSAGQELVLVHALDFPASQRLESEKREIVANAERGLEAAAARLRKHHTLVTARVLFGELAEVLIQEAYEQKAQLLVVGAHGREAASAWRVGSVTDTLASKAGIPLLVVRADDALCAWALERKPLRIIVGADDSATTDAAVRFVATLQALGPCEVSAVHMFWPQTAFERLGLSGIRSFLELDPVVQQTLTEELAQRLGGIPVHIQPHLGNIGERLATIAADSGADLVVVGSHGYTGAAKVWHGSISRDVLHGSSLSVASVPLSATIPTVRRFQRGLVATDLSDLGNAALALAFSAVPSDGTVHIVHVVAPREKDATEPSDIFAPEAGAPAASRAAFAKLTALARQQEMVTPCRFHVHVLESRHPAKAIAQAAERLHADFICLSTSGRPAVSRLVMGSVARAVLADTHRPVLLAQALPR